MFYLPIPTLIYRERLMYFGLGIYKSLTDMNVEIGAEAAQFPEKECINGIFLAVHHCHHQPYHLPSHQSLPKIRIIFYHCQVEKSLFNRTHLSLQYSGTIFDLSLSCKAIVFVGLMYHCHVAASCITTTICTFCTVWYSIAEHSNHFRVCRTISSS
jgi:hypothetical protein